jgi:hypothetical protein
LLFKLSGIFSINLALIILFGSIIFLNLGFHNLVNELSSIVYILLFIGILQELWNYSR